MFAIVWEYLPVAEKDLMIVPMVTDKLASATLRWFDKPEETNESAFHKEPNELTKREPFNSQTRI